MEELPLHGPARHFNILMSPVITTKLHNKVKTTLVLTDDGTAAQLAQGHTANKQWNHNLIHSCPPPALKAHGKEEKAQLKECHRSQSSF